MLGKRQSDEIIGSWFKVSRKIINSNILDVKQNGEVGPEKLMLDM